MLVNVNVGGGPHWSTGGGALRLVPALTEGKGQDQRKKLKWYHGSATRMIKAYHGSPTRMTNAYFVESTGQILQANGESGLRASPNVPDSTPSPSLPKSLKIIR